MAAPEPALSLSNGWRACARRAADCGQLADIELGREKATGRPDVLQTYLAAP